MLPLLCTIVLTMLSLGPLSSSKVILQASRCSPSLLGCHCHNLESITEMEIEPCCKKTMGTLLITGPLVKNISIDVSKSECARKILSLVIRETGVLRFYSPFRGLTSVTDVNIEKNPVLSDFHKLVFEEINPGIVNVFVESNNLRTISRKTFGNLTKLTSLRLSDNKIGYIEEHSFANLRNLTILYMNNNLLTLLSCEVFFGLEALTVLSLFNNPLQQPKSGDLFKYLQNLNFLMMSHVSNVELPGINQLPQRIFFSVKQLKILNMTSIRLRNLTALTFYGLDELERLDLRGNLLTVISSGTMQQIPKITSINLSKNRLICLLPDTFQSLPKLTNLDLSQNELTYISEDVFKELIRLQTLDLSENNIYVIEKNAFVGVVSLMIIKVNVIHGQAKLQIQRNFRSSPLAKLRNTTKIVGLYEYFGVSEGINQPAESPTDINLSEQKVVSVCPVASDSDKQLLDSSTTGSRKYLLVIVGICVLFLLVAFTVIMTYRAWSKRRKGAMNVSVECSQGKVEMKTNGNQIANDRPDIKAGSKTSHRQDTDDIFSGDSSRKNKRHSNNMQHSDDHRCHSDDDSALTPLGVL